MASETVIKSGIENDDPLVDQIMQITWICCVMLCIMLTISLLLMQTARCSYFSYFFMASYIFLCLEPISYIFHQIPICLKMLQIKCIDFQYSYMYCVETCVSALNINSYSCNKCYLHGRKDPDSVTCGHPA